MDHYSFTDPWGMDGWVGHVGWPIADGLTARSLIQLAVWRRIGKVRRDQRSNHYATVATLPTAYMCCDLPPHHSREWAISVLRAVAFGVCALSSGVRVWLTYDFFFVIRHQNLVSSCKSHILFQQKKFTRTWRHFSSYQQNSLSCLSPVCLSYLQRDSFSPFQQLLLLLQPWS